MNLTDRLKEARRRAHQARHSTAIRGRETHINVGGRTNLQAAVNVGGGDNAHVASSRQDAPVTQSDG